MPHPFSHRATKRHCPPEPGETCHGEPAGKSAVSVLLPLAFLSTGEVVPNPPSSEQREPSQHSNAPKTPRQAVAKGETAQPTLGQTSPNNATRGVKKITPSTPKTAYRAAFTITTTTPLHPQPTRWLTTAHHFSKTWDSSPKKGGNVTD